tara:strand:- start:6999 stop:7535 length:537 start_codon:yes stop_codon:yes gene_type:complete
MSFDIKITFQGEVQNFYNINVESGASLALHIGSGRSSSNGTKFKKCPINITKEERTTYASITCSNSHTQPEGWEVESWSLEKAFISKPDGLEKGAPIFYWCTDGKDIPSGFQAVKKEGSNIIIVPSNDTDDDVESTANDDSESSSSLSSLDSDGDGGGVSTTANDDSDFSSGQDLKDD